MDSSYRLRDLGRMAEKTENLRNLALIAQLRGVCSIGRTP